MIILKHVFNFNVKFNTKIEMSYQPNNWIINQNLKQMKDSSLERRRKFYDSVVDIKNKREQYMVNQRK